MKIRHFLLLALCLLTATASAVPARPGLWSVITLSDGTTVSAQLVGDEHGHWLQAADGSCYLPDDTVADTYRAVDADVLQALRQARLDAKTATRRAIYTSTTDGLGRKGLMGMGPCPSIGQYTIPVIMVQFTDTKFKATTTVDKMKRYYNEEGYSEGGAAGSVRDYFVAQSGGQFVPTFDVVGIVTLDKPSSYYGTNDENSYDAKLPEISGDAIAAAVSQLGTDFNKYVVPAGDEHHNEGVPLLCMLYAGRGEATEPLTSANSKLIWPIEWDDVEDRVGRGNYQGVHFNSFFVGNEVFTGGISLMGQGVFCHEFGHALGLPDFYCTDGSYNDDHAFGFWSVMDTGVYVTENGTKPVGYNAYEKSCLGWLELKELPADAPAVVLQSPHGLAEGSAYIYRVPSVEGETFIFENRQPGTWYPEAFGSGVLVTRIHYDQATWANNTLNNVKDKKRALVLTADGGKLNYSADPANLYGDAKKSIIRLKTYGGANCAVGIFNILKGTDGTATLVLQDGYDPSGVSTVYRDGTRPDPNAPRYDLGGRRVPSDSHGIHIVNGKKVVN